MGLLGNKTDVAPQPVGADSGSLIKKAEQEIEAKIPADFKNAYSRIVIAGMKVMFDKSTHGQMLRFLEAEGDITDSIANGIGQLIGILYRESSKQTGKPTMPMEAAIPAALTLMLKAIEYAAGLGKLQATPEIIDQITQKTIQKIAEAQGIDKGQMDAAMQSGDKMMQNEELSAKFSQMNGGE